MSPEQTRQTMREMRDLALRSEPMTDADRAERRRLIAREYARAEARRQPEPQLPLAEAA